MNDITKNIILVGVGGQGTILISKILSVGLVQKGYDVKMSEIHGMSQRGGSVTTQIKYGEKVYAPNIGEGEADIIISFEKTETIRALPYLKKGGTVITDVHEIYSMPVLTGTVEYPHDAIDVLAKSIPNVMVVKAAEVAQKLGNTRAQNIVLLGALVKSMKLDDIDWEPIVAQFVPAKAKDVNIAAFRAGFEM